MLWVPCNAPMAHLRRLRASTHATRRSGAHSYNNALDKSASTEGPAVPIHDWTRVTAGTWHDFHLAWIAEIRNALNGGILPADYYAQAEQIAGPLGPDVLTLQVPD